MARHGLTIPDFAQFAFVLHNLFERYAAGPANALPNQCRLSVATVKAALALISAPLEAARAGARSIRKSRHDINYQASQLRMTPVISFRDGETLRAPIPDLIVVRATEGLYYDLVGARGHVRNEVSDRFETYTREFLAASLPDRQAEPAAPYRWRGLRGELKGWWSPRITLEDRLVYRVSGAGAAQQLEIAQCRYHY